MRDSIGSTHGFILVYFKIKERLLFTCVPVVCVRSCDPLVFPVIVTVFGKIPWVTPGMVMVMGLPIGVVVLADETITILIPPVAMFPVLVDIFVSGNIETVDVVAVFNKKKLFY